MAYATSSDWVIWLAFTVGCLLLFFTIMLFAMMLLLRVTMVKKQERRSIFIETWAPIWNQCLNNELPNDIPTLATEDINTFLVQWIQYQETYDESMREILNLVALKAGVESKIQAIFKQNNIKEKILGITAVGFLRDKSYWYALNQFVQSNNTFISLAAARALLHIDSKSAMPLLIHRIQEREDWPQARVMLFLAEAGINTISQPLADAARLAPVHLAPRMIRYLEVVSSTVALPTINYILSIAIDEQVILATLQTLVKFDPSSLLENVRRFLFHPSWAVRAAAIKLVGKAGDISDESRLVQLLSDPQSIVQYEAAQALFRMPNFTMEHCLEIQQYLSSKTESITGSMVLTRVMTEKQLKP